MRDVDRIRIPSRVAFWGINICYTPPPPCISPLRAEDLLAGPQLVFTSDNRFSSSGLCWSGLSGLSVRLQETCMSATSHTGWQAVRVMGLCDAVRWGADGAAEDQARLRRVQGVRLHQIRRQGGREKGKLGVGTHQRVSLPILWAPKAGLVVLGRFPIYRFPALRCACISWNSWVKGFEAVNCFWRWKLLFSVHLRPPVWCIFYNTASIILSFHCKLPTD